MSIRFKINSKQGRSDGVSRVSNAYGPTAEGGPPKAKFYTRYSKKIAKIRKIKILDVLLMGPRKPRYGPDSKIL